MGVTAPVPPVVDVCLYKYTPDMEKIITAVVTRLVSLHFLNYQESVGLI